MENIQNDLFFEVVDEDGVTHKLKLLSIFTAGNLNKKYVAGLTTDIYLYRYCPKAIGVSDYKSYIEEIFDEVEYEAVAKLFEEFINAGIDSEEIQTKTLYINAPADDGGTVELPIDGTVYKIFEEYSFRNQYVAFCPTNIMFYRYNEIEKDGQQCLEISTIYSPQEYEDVTEMFESALLKTE